jgi:hypothetical protein
MGARMRVPALLREPWLSVAWCRRGATFSLGLALASLGPTAAVADPPSEALAPLAGATGPAGLAQPIPEPARPMPGSGAGICAPSHSAPRSLSARQPDFPKSPGLVPRVEFWKRIYSEVATSGGLLHDGEELSRV